MVAIPLSLVFGAIGLVCDRIKAPAILGALVSGGLFLFWLLAILGVLWC